MGTKASLAANAGDRESPNRWIGSEAIGIFHYDSFVAWASTRDVRRDEARSNEKEKREKALNERRSSAFRREGR
jgi:hypothetical protein